MHKPVIVPGFPVFEDLEEPPGVGQRLVHLVVSAVELADRGGYIVEEALFDGEIAELLEKQDHGYEQQQRGAPASGRARTPASDRLREQWVEISFQTARDNGSVSP